jgi:hypothetical protein
MDDHTKDSKKSPIYQFQLLVTRITLYCAQKKNIVALYCLLMFGYNWFYFFPFYCIFFIFVTK